MKSSPIELTDLPEAAMKVEQPLKHRLTSNASRSKYFKLKQNNYEQSPTNSEVMDH